MNAAQIRKVTEWGEERESESLLYILCDAAWMHHMVANISTQLNFPLLWFMCHCSVMNGSRWTSALVCSQLMWCGHVTTHTNTQIHTHTGRLWFTPLLREPLWFILLLAVAVTLKQTLLQYEWPECWFNGKKRHTRSSTPSSLEAQSALQQRTEPASYSVSPTACV